MRDISDRLKFHSLSPLPSIFHSSTFTKFEQMVFYPDIIRIRIYCHFTYSVVVVVVVDLVFFLIPSSSDSLTHPKCLILISCCLLLIYINICLAIEMQNDVVWKHINEMREELKYPIDGWMNTVLVGNIRCTGTTTIQTPIEF